MRKLLASLAQEPRQASLKTPSTRSTDAIGINDKAEIVGSWTDAADNTHGFYAVKQ
jgi:hypothetical protein